jgi:hypothetical protein
MTQDLPVEASSKQPGVSHAAPAEPQPERRHLIEQVGSFAVTQFYAVGFDRLSPSERLLAYHLAEAGIAGDPIYYDQIAPYGLQLKQLLEGIWTHPEGIDALALRKIRHYTKLVWIQTVRGNFFLNLLPRNYGLRRIARSKTEQISAFHRERNSIRCWQVWKGRSSMGITGRS